MESRNNFVLTFRLDWVNFSLYIRFIIPHNSETGFLSTDCKLRKIMRPILVIHEIIKYCQYQLGHQSEKRRSNALLETRIYFEEIAKIFENSANSILKFYLWKLLNIIILMKKTRKLAVLAMIKDKYKLFPLRTVKINV